jgi:putative membrane protein
MIKYNSKTFFNDSDKNQIENTIKEVEKKTSGEIAVMVVNESEKYKESVIFGAFLLSLLFSLIIQYFIPEIMWFIFDILKISPEIILKKILTLPFQLKYEFKYILMYGIWTFTPLVIILFILFKFIISKIKFLKRIFLTEKQIDYEVKEKAMTAFFEQGLYKTRDATGILFLISLLEKRVFILADKGIYEKIKQKKLDEFAVNISKGVKASIATKSLCDAITDCGKILEKNFPIKKDDTNELSNRIIIE